MSKRMVAHDAEDLKASKAGSSASDSPSPAKRRKLDSPPPSRKTSTKEEEEALLQAMKNQICQREKNESVTKKKPAKNNTALGYGAYGSPPSEYANVNGPAAGYNTYAPGRFNPAMMSLSRITRSSTLASMNMNMPAPSSPLVEANDASQVAPSEPAGRMLPPSSKASATPIPTSGDDEDALLVPPPAMTQLESVLKNELPQYQDIPPGADEYQPENADEEEKPIHIDDEYELRVVEQARKATRPSLLVEKAVSLLMKGITMVPIGGARVYWFFVVNICPFMVVIVDKFVDMCLVEKAVSFLIKGITMVSIGVARVYWFFVVNICPFMVVIVDKFVDMSRNTQAHRQQRLIDVSHLRQMTYQILQDDPSISHFVLHIRDEIVLCRLPRKRSACISKKNVGLKLSLIYSKTLGCYKRAPT